MTATTARDLGRAAAQKLLRTDPLSKHSINLIADAVMNAYAPGRRAEVLAEVQASIEDPARRREAAVHFNMGSGLGWEAARDIVRLMLSPAPAPTDPGSGT
jgi:hypothetical protein